MEYMNWAKQVQEEAEAKFLEPLDEYSLREVCKIIVECRKIQKQLSY